MRGRLLPGEGAEGPIPGPHRPPGGPVAVVAGREQVGRDDCRLGVGRLSSAAAADGGRPPAAGGVASAAWRNRSCTNVHMPVPGARSTHACGRPLRRGVTVDRRRTRHRPRSTARNGLPSTAAATSTPARRVEADRRCSSRSRAPVGKVARSRAPRVVGQQAAELHDQEGVAGRQATTGRPGRRRASDRAGRRAARRLAAGPGPAAHPVGAAPSRVSGEPAATSVAR